MGSRKKGRNGSPMVDDDKRDDILQKSDMNNQKFDAYYKNQLAMDNDEWSTLLDVCREPLPSTFRISGSRECVLLFPLGARVINVSIRTAAVLTSLVEKTYVPHLTGVVFEDQPIPAPLALPW
jgi:multisite-specific tRNA:(cytosine-C5)-methyltransferase